jgi:hypothetical protein
VPGGRSLVSGVYELRDAFGMPTITKLFILEGSEAPAAPHGFKWRLIELARVRGERDRRPRPQRRQWIC